MNRKQKRKLYILPKNDDDDDDYTTFLFLCMPHKL